MLQVAKSMENSTKQQEENKDARLQTLLESDRKRDEMFFAYQREQAEANRKHELMMAQILLQATSNARPQHESGMPPASQVMPLPSSFSTWNNSYSSSDSQAERPFYHKI